MWVRPGLSGLVNNAGIAIGSPLELIPLQQLRRQLEVNVVGQIAVTQAVLPLLRRAHGRIVNMGSIAGRGTIPMMGPYSASKHALEALTDALRLELYPWGIEVSIIEPGAVATPIWDKSMPDLAGCRIGDVRLTAGISMRVLPRVSEKRLARPRLAQSRWMQLSRRCCMPLRPDGRKHAISSAGMQNCGPSWRDGFPIGCKIGS